MENRKLDQGINISGRQLGELIIARRKELNWTQDDLEYQSGVSVRQISRIECNQSRPSMETIEKLERALGISLVGTYAEHYHPGTVRKGSKQKQERLLKKLKDEATRRGLSDEDVTAALEKAIAEVEEKASEVSFLPEIGCPEADRK